MRLALGTAQFGMRYGIANATGRVPPAQVLRLLELARHHGVDTLDTAMSYGDSEAVLGQCDLRGFKLISKLPEVPPSTPSLAHWLLARVQASLRTLGIAHLHALLLHRPAQLLQAQGAELADALQQLKARGLVQRVGVSIYDPAELAPLLQVMTPDVVQAPLNLVDRRLVSTGWLARLHAMGIAVHVRSVFLQGLLLMPRASRPAAFAAWPELWQSWDDWRDAHGHHRAHQACLAFVLSHPQIERALVGVDNEPQLAQLLGSLPTLSCDWPDLACEDPRLINPSHWSSP